MRQFKKMTRGRERDTERRTWHGMNQPKPRLPYYFRSDDEVTLRGVLREVAGFLVMFAIAAVIVVSAWNWLYGSQTCVELVRGFKMGWC